MLNNEQIQKILPQRYPFLLLDKVVDFKKNERLIAIKNASINEEYFMGHFPAKPIMPGVLLIEVMGQAGIIFLNLNNAESEDDLQKPDIYYLYSVKARFFNPISPGDKIVIEVLPVKLTKDSGIMKITAKVGDKEIARAELAGTKHK